MADLSQLSSDLYRLGREALDHRDLARALVLLRCSAELDPHFKTLELLGEILLESHGASSDAIVTLSAAVGLGGKQPRPLFLLAKALSMRGAFSDAIEKLDRAVEIQPSYKAAIHLRDELRTRLVHGSESAPNCNDDSR